MYLSNPNWSPTWGLKVHVKKLNNALHWGQQAQMLLMEQAQQLQSCSITGTAFLRQSWQKSNPKWSCKESLWGKDEAEKKRSSLCQLNRYLTQLEQEECWLEVSIHDAKSDLCIVEKGKYLIASHMKSVESTPQNPSTPPSMRYISVTFEFFNQSYSFYEAIISKYMFSRISLSFNHKAIPLKKNYT